MDMRQLRQGLRDGRPAPVSGLPRIMISPAWWRPTAIATAAILTVISIWLILAPAFSPKHPAVPTAPVSLDAIEAQGPPTGAPLLWVMKDADTTIYLFGSVHILRQNLNWMDPRLFRAFDSADQAWFEVPALDKLPPFKGFSGRVYDSRPVLLNGLTDTEKSQLKVLVARYDATLEDVARVRPEAMASFVREIDEMGGGLSIQRGADFTLFNRARDMKKKTDGFESYGEHYGYLTQLQAGSGDTGTADLKRALAAHFGTGSPDDDANVMVKYWRTGDEKAITDSVLRMAKANPLQYDLLLVQRNGKWVPRIEAMLQTKGTVFITVGAAHLVGPDGLVAQLRARGHTVTRLDPGKA